MFILLDTSRPKRTTKDYLKKVLASTLLVMTLAAQSGVYANPSNQYDRNTIQIRGGISVGVKGDDVIKALALRDAEIKDVLYSLAEQGNFNLIVDESVEGSISLDLKDISINKVLEYILTLADLSYYKDGNTFIVTSTSNANKKALNKLVLKSIRVKYSNAQELANVLNKTVFSINRPGGNTNAIATADQRTNSILIMGNEQDIDLANRALAELDFPLQHRTFFLKNAPAMDVAKTIAQTLFSVSLSSAGQGGGSSGGSGGQSGGASGSGGGEGSSSEGGGESSSSSGGGSSSGSSSGSGSGPVQVMKAGPVTFIANTVNNTLTLIGTAEQIDLVESMLYDVDIKPAQVAIQVSVMELSETRNKALNAGLNSDTGEGSLSTKNGNVSLGFDGPLAFFSWNNNAASRVGPLLDQLNFQSSLTQTKAKILANPTIVAVSGTASNINVTNEVVTGSTIVTNPESGETRVQLSKASVGITLQIQPTVSPDGTVSLQINPSVSAPSGQVTDSEGNSITLVSSDTLSVAQVRVKDGQTLVLGGLIRETSSFDIQKFPFLSDVPILGALFRASQTNNKARTELVILVTPHIVKEEGVPYFRKDWQDKLSYDRTSFNGQHTIGNSGMEKFIPAANTKQGYGSTDIQTLEQRQQDSQKAGESMSKKSSTLPLQTYSEVLK